MMKDSDNENTRDRSSMIPLIDANSIGTQYSSIDLIELNRKLYKSQTNDLIESQLKKRMANKQKMIEDVKQSEEK